MQAGNLRAHRKRHAEVELKCVLAHSPAHCVLFACAHQALVWLHACTHTATWFHDVRPLRPRRRCKVCQATFEAPKDYTAHLKWAHAE